MRAGSSMPWTGTSPASPTMRGSIARKCQRNLRRASDAAQATPRDTGYISSGLSRQGWPRQTVDIQYHEGESSHDSEVHQHVVRLNRLPCLTAFARLDADALCAPTTHSLRPLGQYRKR